MLYDVVGVGPGIMFVMVLEGQWVSRGCCRCVGLDDILGDAKEVGEREKGGAGRPHKCIPFARMLLVGLVHFGAITCYYNIYCNFDFISFSSMTRRLEVQPQQVKT